MACIPYLNKLVSDLSQSQLLKVLGIFSFVIVLLPTIGVYSQGTEQISLFIFLYLLIVVIKYQRIIIGFKVGFLLWLLSFITLFLSPFLIVLVSNGINSDYFFKYNSILVVGEAIGYFIMLYKLKPTPNICKIIKWFSDFSLICYLLHMHPVLKQHYLEMSFFKELNTITALSYCINILFISLGVYLFGIIWGIPFCKLSKTIASKFTSS